MSFKHQSFFFIGFICFFIFSTGCNSSLSETDSHPVFTLLDPEETGLNFINRLDERPDFNIFFYDYFYNGSGVAIGDINNDGLPDVLLTANTSGNRLFLNKGDMKFEDITEGSGLKTGRWSAGAVFVDINNDGLIDIYICNGGPYKDPEMLKNELYINNGDGTFTESADAYGVAGFHMSSQASFFDYDGDGDLDLFVLNYNDLVYRVHDLNQISDISYPKEKFRQNSCALYRNDGNGKFTDVSEEAGIMTPSSGLGVITSDFNGDGLVDIYVSNDYLIPNFLFINQGDGTFKDMIKEHLDHCSHFSMGVDYADFNNDGLYDIFEVDMMPDDHILNKVYMRPMQADLFFQVVNLGLIPQFMFNSFHIQHGYGVYSNIAHMAGIGKTDWSWSALMVDFDNDGWKDILVTNGFRRNLKNNDYSQQQLPQISEWMRQGQYDSCFAFLQEYPGYPLLNFIYKNNRDLTFKNMSTEWGFEIPSYSTGAAYADLDGDGDLDLIINNIDQPAFLYRNNSEKNKNDWIRFDLSDKTLNRIPYNAKVEVILKNGQILCDELKTVRGYLGAVEPVIHIGLGQKPEIKAIRIIWPDKSITRLAKWELNKVNRIEKSELIRSDEPILAPPVYNFADLSGSLFKELFKHTENKYHDFHTEILLPYKHSTLGPFIATGDVNGDGNTDFFIGGAKGQSGKLYIMDPRRGFYQAACQPWENQANSEDMGAVFFDFDGDGDLDVYICSGGGGEFAYGDESLQDRLYINDGNGCFSGPLKTAVPDVRASSGRVISEDWDNDGDFDLFVAGRNNPGKYPLPGESLLLRNEGGILKDVTDQLAPGLRNIGMVTDARFHDFNGDGLPDLLLCGEWMSLKLFIQENGRFVDRSKEYGLSEKVGKWFSIELADVNNDGKMDIIAGNLGKNNKFKIREDNPLHVYAADFDDNGTLDIVLSNSYKGNLVPVRGRQCSSDQMPFIKEKFPSFSKFASATLEDVYGKEKLESALHYAVNEPRSMVWINEGKKFKPIPLPNDAQLGPVLSIAVADFNKDGIPDLMIGGDLSDTEPETPSYDGNRGMILTGNGDGTFNPIWYRKSGFYFTARNVRDIATLKPRKSDETLFLISASDGHLQALLFVGMN